MRQESAIQSVEIFHLALLGVFEVRLGLEKYVLKGGANLRFFFNSPRYSEDMDFDAREIGRWKLETKVDEVLDSGALRQTVLTRGLTIARVSKPKQTDTTQRWKVALAIARRIEPYWTKIEFSRRRTDEETQLNQVRPEVAAKYAFRPPTARHYSAGAMIRQKIVALAERSETQARDIFDLNLLFTEHPEETSAGQITPDLVGLAVDRVRELPLEAYLTQVVQFMEPDVVELYDSERAWDQMQRNVIEKLELLK